MDMLLMGKIITVTMPNNQSIYIPIQIIQSSNFIFFLFLNLFRVHIRREKNHQRVSYGLVHKYDHSTVKPNSDAITESYMLISVLFLSHLSVYQLSFNFFLINSIYLPFLKNSFIALVAAVFFSLRVLKDNSSFYYFNT